MNGSEPVRAQDLEFALYCDGASRGNPGAAALGYVLFDAAGAEVLARGAAIGHETNNVAEYRALLAGLDAALAHGVRRIAVHLDSELVVRQVLGIYRVRHAALQPLCAAVQERRCAFQQFRIRHIPRAQNKRADALANAALDDLESEA